MDFSKKIPNIENKIGYTFRDKSLLRQAFTRTSYCNEKNYRGRENVSSNEVLEFFGDSVLSVAIISLLIKDKTKRYEHGIMTELTEGDMSNIRSKLSDKRNLSESMAALGLHKLLLMGEGDEKLGIGEEASVMEDLFESIIGAVYMDCDMDIGTVIGVVKNMLDVSVYSSGEAPIQSYKNALQEWCADKKRRLPPPVYKTKSESGPDHKKVYERECYIDGKLYGVGMGKNQKIADTNAAKCALEKLRTEENPDNASGNAHKSLREYAQKNKLTLPEYHDLGKAPCESEDATQKIVECTFMGISVSASGKTSALARDGASAKMMEIISRDVKENTSVKSSAKKSAPKVKDEGSDKSNRKEPKGKSAKVASPKKDQQNGKVSASKNTATPSPEKSNRQKSNTKQKSGKSSVKSGAPANTGNRKKTKLTKKKKTERSQ